MTSDDGRPERRPASGPPPASGPLAGAGPPALDQLFDSDSLYALRSAVAAHAGQAGLPVERGDDLVIAVHELAANVVRHGAGTGRLRLWNEGEVLRCQVTDAGPPAAAAGSGPDGPGPGPPADGIPPWIIEHGHGLWLVRQVADELSLQSGPGGSIATISFSIRLRR